MIPVSHNRKSILAIAFSVMMLSAFGQKAPRLVKSPTEKWFPKYDFNLRTFQNPALDFAPFTRWWWPGNSVDKTELRREINLFADNGFGGVEIQPINRFAPGPKEVRAKEITWDTPDYYDNVIAVMQEARKRGITVDMSDGSGWPAGGPYLSAEDGFLTLDHAEVDVVSGPIAIALPTVKKSTAVPPRLEAVLAVKKGAKPTGDNTKTTRLDSASTIVLTSFVKNDSLQWKSPAGDWTIIAFWSKQQGQNAFTATPKQGPVMDHFDSSKVLKNYRHLFGPRTGLQPYFGNPMRAVFDDSYEFSVDRHYSLNFLDFFKKRRGYDLAPWLPAQMQKGYNFVVFSRPVADPDFSFSDQDWRLKYDYDLTLSEVLGEQFEDATRNWLEPQGLLHRTQAYGFNSDMMALAGQASIPETESMIGPEASLKLMASGGLLYNRPIVSAESVVFANRAYTNTPQKIKIAVDKLFAAGVNQIIYHGVPYHYTPTELGPEGWYPFSRPNSGTSYSSNLGEGNIFWKDQKAINDYIRRTQYALRSGKPHADVLIYFPFMDIEGMPDNPEEILAKGELPGVEGPLPPTKEVKSAAKEKWAQTAYPLINQLESNGITWAWVNDLSIQAAQLTPDKRISIRGNTYQALVLADDTTMQVKTAQQIGRLAANGMNLLTIGRLPQRQPSFLNWKENDQKTAQAIAAAVKAQRSTYVKSDAELTTWISSLPRPVKFRNRYSFTRLAQLNMSDGSRIQFIWNKSDQWQTLSLSLNKQYKTSYWINADLNTAIQDKGPVVTYRMPPYGSVILYASTQEQNVSSPASKVATDEGKELIRLDTWSLKADSVAITNSPLFDWRSNEQLKFSSSEGVYTTSFKWSKPNSATRYTLDLGRVSFIADVFVNGKSAGKRIFAPYTLDITPLLIVGTNQLEIRVTPGQLNGFIQKAKLGDGRYRQFKNKEDQLMSAGLLGPVIIREN
ncbi:hypothetical protein GO755_12965 [Spirosoma sp. HMF4905]|uniref:Beta-mannosidase-like galactose-binding domain-containing protein n=1 Tax=Spirosoma arboris TaxID=2682092 RepID=A0A7K1SBK6_9BACT|nr:glycosyl hydrolase [Spirosoma arboris]MVM30946.1 hypothetical protein [Spirosoma arboris]